jgi:hypothetical protein
MHSTILAHRTRGRPPPEPGIAWRPEGCSLSTHAASQCCHPSKRSVLVEVVPVNGALAIATTPTAAGCSRTGWQVAAAGRPDDLHHVSTAIYSGVNAPKIWFCPALRERRQPWPAPRSAPRRSSAQHGRQPLRPAAAAGRPDTHNRTHSTLHNGQFHHPVHAGYVAGQVAVSCPCTG